MLTHTPEETTLIVSYTHPKDIVRNITLYNAFNQYLDIHGLRLPEELEERLSVCVHCSL
jgi:uncharacterized phage protein gp47/JayE